MRSPYIVLEGPDGSGTTSHCSLLVAALERMGKKVQKTAEPTDGPVGKFIRECLTGKAGLPASALQLLFCADRAMHDERMIRPTLDAGEFVVGDRCAVSTLAYGEALGLDPAWLEQVNSAFTKPDLLILAMAPLNVCMERLHIRPSADILEGKTLQAKVHEAYMTMAKEHPEWIVVDTSGPLQETARVIEEHVKAFL
jgi:dTMP kinase